VDCRTAAKLTFKVIAALIQLVQLSATFLLENALGKGWYYHGYGVMSRLYILAIAEIRTQLDKLIESNDT